MYFGLRESIRPQVTPLCLLPYDPFKSCETPLTSLSLSLSVAMMVAASTPSRTEILSLFRSLLRISREFSDYNIKYYTRRRTIDGFRQNCNLTDPSAISSAFSDGKSQLEVAKRQAVVYSLYAPKVKSVMELQK